MMPCHLPCPWVSGSQANGPRRTVDLLVLLVWVQVSLYWCIHTADQRCCRIARHQIFFCANCCSNCLPFNLNSKGFLHSGEWKALLSK
jgi:hypothetical protein